MEKVVSYNMAVKLKENGFPQPVEESNLSWYSTLDVTTKGELVKEGTLFTNPTQDEFIDFKLIFAPTAQFIIEDGTKRFGQSFVDKVKSV
jgi:hypothetical protein